MITHEKASNLIFQSNYISRDLSWLKFNMRVLDQAKSTNRSIFDRLKFLAITASNLDEFFMIRLGNLYNYIDYSKDRIDYSGLREKPFARMLLKESQYFYHLQQKVFTHNLVPKFAENGFKIAKISDLTETETNEVGLYFMKTIFPMLTPMVFDNYHPFPILMNKTLIFGVVTKAKTDIDDRDDKRVSFVQIPQNLPRFYEFDRADDELLFLPIEEIIRWKMDKLFRNVEILSVDLFRITRNGDFALEESDDLEDDFIDEIKRKLKTRKTGRVVRIEIGSNYSEWMMRLLKKRWTIDEDNIFVTNNLLDFTSLAQIFGHEEFIDKISQPPTPVLPLGLDEANIDIFEYLKKRDILLHHPYNSIEYLLQLLEKAAEDANVLAIKITIYRLAKKSRVTNALLKAAENGKHVSVLFELKARFDEENNIREAERLQKAGCFVIHGIGHYKTHAKMMLIVRKEDAGVVRYVHMSSGNYNEVTARIYTDLSLLTTNEGYAHDVSEFFNAITGHSNPLKYKNLITAPRDMRNSLIQLIRNEAENAKKGLKSGIIIKINSLEDQVIIDELYLASQAGVKIDLIVRGICCLRPQRVGLSENIMVRSIVGDFLEHMRIYYFQNEERPKIFVGSADMMVRSFDRRIESLFLILSETINKQIINILHNNLMDNMNTYIMQEDGSYLKRKPQKGEKHYNIHHEFFNLYAKKEILQISDIITERKEETILVTPESEELQEQETISLN
jgi:polyphosphate kinase